MKKYKVIHDSTLLGIPTIPTNDCNQITDAGMGVGKGQIVYGVPAQRKRMGIGVQSFIHIASPTHISGKEVLGMYVPASAVQEIREASPKGASSSNFHGADGTAQRKFASAKNLRGFGSGLLISGAIVSLSSKEKVKAVPYIIAVGGVVMFASLFFEE